MPLDVKEECRPMYEKLYKWHTEEIKKLDLELEITTGEKQKRIKIVENRLIVERKRIRKIYPEIFSEDEFDSRLGSPTIE